MFFIKGNRIVHPFAAPWERDGYVTDAFVADAKYMSFSTGNVIAASNGWLPAKGTQTTVASSLLWHGAGPNDVPYDSFGDGYVLFSSLGFFEVDGMATEISGASKPWTIIISGRIPVNPGANSRLYSFGNSGNANSLIDCSVTGSGTQLFFDRRTDAGVLSSSAGSYLPGNTAFVLTAIYNGSTFTGRLNGTQIESGTSFGTGTVTLNRFTMGCFHTTGVPSLFTKPDIRAFVFGPSAFSASSYLPIERYLMRQVGI